MRVVVRRRELEHGAELRLGLAVAPDPEVRDAERLADRRLVRLAALRLLERHGRLRRHPLPEVLPALLERSYVSLTATPGTRKFSLTKSSGCVKSRVGPISIARTAQPASIAALECVRELVRRPGQVARGGREPLGPRPISGADASGVGRIVVADARRRGRPGCGAASGAAGSAAGRAGRRSRRPRRSRPTPRANRAASPGVNSVSAAETRNGGAAPGVERAPTASAEPSGLGCRTKRDPSPNAEPSPASALDLLREVARHERHVLDPAAASSRSNGRAPAGRRSAAPASRSARVSGRSRVPSPAAITTASRITCGSCRREACREPRQRSRSK